MIVTQCDGTNIGMAMDLLHAKLLVELMRTLNMDAHKKAVEKVFSDGGFMVTELDSVVASGSFVSVVGKYTDGMRLKTPEKEGTNTAGSDASIDGPKALVN